MNELTEEIINKVITLRKLGKTYLQINKELKITKDKIKKICTENNLPFKKVYTDEEIKHFNTVYKEIGTIRGAAIQLKMGRCNLAKILNHPQQPKTIKTNSDYVSKHRKERKKLLVEYKGGKCQNCGYSKSLCALHFHHINPKEKDFEIGTTNYNLKRCIKETDKCILVCSNCHLEIHEEIRVSGFSEIQNRVMAED